MKVLNRLDSLKGIDFEAGAALLIDKPAGITSFGVVARLRRMIGVRKIGHTGTLDPSATGLMILLTGKATRSQAAFMKWDKEYLAEILLGVTTDTWDLDGQITHQAAVVEATREQVQQALENHFCGEIEQTPPIYSALKIGGVPSYRLARKGKSVELKPRRVTVYSLSIESWSPPLVVLRVTCSSGFYVRSLAHELGVALGCGASLKSLIRTRLGSYSLPEAFKLDEVEA